MVAMKRTLLTLLTQQRVFEMLPVALRLYPGVTPFPSFPWQEVLLRGLTSCTCNWDERSTAAGIRHRPSRGGGPTVSRREPSCSPRPRGRARLRAQKLRGPSSVAGGHADFLDCSLSPADFRACQAAKQDPRFEHELAPADPRAAHPRRDCGHRTQEQPPNSHQRHRPAKGALRRRSELAPSAATSSVPSAATSIKQPTAAPSTASLKLDCSVPAARGCGPLSCCGGGGEGSLRRRRTASPAAVRRS